MRPETLRPDGWKPDPKITKKVKEAMKDPEVKSNVERARKKNNASKKEESPTTPTTTELPTEHDDSKTFAITWHHDEPPAAEPSMADLASSFSVLKISDHDIINSWILGSGSNIHDCKDPSRFTMTHSSTAKDYVVSGSTKYPIEAYGKVALIVALPKGAKENITLSEVALIAGDFIILVSLSRTKTAKIY